MTNVRDCKRINQCISANLADDDKTFARVSKQRTRTEKAVSADEAKAEFKNEVWMLNRSEKTQKVEELEDEDTTYAWACRMMDAAEKAEEDEETAREADLLYRTLKREHEAKEIYDEKWEEDSWDQEQWQYPGPATNTILSYE